MPDPIHVDFRRRPKKKPAPAPARRRPVRPGEKAVNWRALPRFLLFMAAMAVLFAGLNWVMKALS